MVTTAASQLNRCVVMMIFVFAALVCEARGQKLTPAEVEQGFRASIEAWNSNDPAKIANTKEAGGFGFGYRTRDPREDHAGRSREQTIARIKKFFADKDYFRITVNQIRTAVDGDFGLAWGFFTEEFQVRGKAPERVTVRFTSTYRKDKAGMRQLLYHRDAQPFDTKGYYIPAAAGAK